MRLTELRQQLEELEQRGYGDRRVDVSPTPPPVKNWQTMSPQEQRRYRLNFTVMDYTVTSVGLPPLINEPPVTLSFTEVAEMPADPDLDEAETFPTA